MSFSSKLLKLSVWVWYFCGALFFFFFFGVEGESEVGAGPVVFFVGFGVTLVFF